MTSILQALYDFLSQLVCWIMTALVLTLNFVLAALGVLVETLTELLPDMPAIPAVPSQITTVAGWINWVFPVGTVAQFLTFIFAAWLLWQAVLIGLRWAKATSE